MAAMQNIVRCLKSDVSLNARNQIIKVWMHLSAKCAMFINRWPTAV